MDSIEVTVRCGITYRQLDYWCRLGLLQPRLEDGENGRPARVFDAAEFKVARLMGKLTKCGVRPSDAIKLARGDAAANLELATVLKECVDGSVYSNFDRSDHLRVDPFGGTWKS